MVLLTFPLLFSFLCTSIGHDISARSTASFSESTSVRYGLHSFSDLFLFYVPSPNTTSCHYFQSPFIFPSFQYTILYLQKLGHCQLPIWQLILSACGYGIFYILSTKLFLPPVRKCWTFSLFWQHKRHSPCSIKPLIFLQGLVSVICSCDVKIDAVFLGSVLHLHLSHI